MKKGLFLLVIFGVFGIATVDAKIRLGAKLGLTFSHESEDVNIPSAITSSYDGDIRYGTCFGLILEGTLPVKNLFYESGVYYAQKGADATIDYTLSGNPDGLAGIQTRKDERLGYIGIPFNVKYKIPLKHCPMKIYFSGGGYFDIGIEGWRKYEYNYTFAEIVENPSMIYPSLVNSDINFGSGDDAAYKRIDMGINLGAGVEVLDHVMLGFNYAIGLNDIRNDNYKPGIFTDSYFTSEKNRSWSLYLAYLF
jgi:hypothetical protein